MSRQGGKLKPLKMKKKEKGENDKDEDEVAYKLVKKEEEAKNKAAREKLLAGGSNPTGIKKSGKKK